MPKAHKSPPKEPAITQWIGFIKLQQGKYTEALSSFQETIRLSPDLPQPYINSGFAYAKLERYPEASAAYQQAIPVIKAYAARHTDGNTLRFQLRKVYYDLGQTYFKQNRFTEALDAYNRAADLNTDKPKELTPQEIALYNDADRRERGKDEALIQDSLGETLDALKKPEEAALAYERAAALEPSNPKYLQQQGLAYRAAAKAAPDSEQAKSDWKQAGQAFLKAVERTPGDYKSREYYAEALEEQGLDTEALTQYTQAAKDRAAAQDAAQTPSDASYHNGLALIHREQWSEAEAQFLQASKEDPNKAAAFQWLGYARYKQNEYDAAIAAYKQAVALQNDQAETHLALGNVYEARNDFAQKDIANAQAEYEKAAGLAPNSARAQYLLGRIYLDQEKYAEAEAPFHTAVTLDPEGKTFDAAQAYAGRGYVLRLLAEKQSAEEQSAERLRDAETAQETAVKLNPALKPSWLEIALIYRDQAQAVDANLQTQHLLPGDYQAQMRDEWNKTAEKLTALLQRSPDIQDIHDLDGSALAKANQGPRAIEQFNQGVSLDKKPYEFLGQLGEALETKQSFAEAEDAYRRALTAYATKHGEESTLLLNHLGRTQIKQEKYGDAAATFAKVLLKTPYDRKAYVYRYEALKGLNQTDEAIAALEDGLKVKDNAARDPEQKQAVAEMERALAYELTRKGGRTICIGRRNCITRRCPQPRKVRKHSSGLARLKFSERTTKRRCLI